MNRAVKTAISGLLLIVSLGGCSHLGNMLAGFGGDAFDAGRYPGARPEVVAAIRKASRQTGAPFQYLLATAAQESGLRPDARAATSSAVGLYQFIESTWLSTVRRHGHKHGLAATAAAIGLDRRGRPYVADAASRHRILALRTDPYLSALMAGELANDNRKHLERVLKRRVGATDLYLAHFLGAGGAAKFLAALRDAPEAAGCDLFPSAAGANRHVFFDGRSTRPRSVAQIFALFQAKIETA
jgi:Transglycosylase SLT domain